MVTHVKENTNKGNHAQHLKYENKVPIKYFGNQDIYFSCNKENIKTYKEKLHEVWEMTWNEENLIYLVCSESPLLTPLNMSYIDSS
jgi:hypothetical protein